MDIPVYLIAGFLDAGKTNFINGVLQDGFASKDRTLLICCEEGEEEYDFSTYPHQNVFLEVLDQETVTEKDFRACGEEIIADLTAYAETQPEWQLADDNREGVRVSFDRDNGDGWFLLRLSVHDPVMPLNIESNTPGGVENILRDLRAFFRVYEVPDSDCLQK